MTGPAAVHYGDVVAQREADGRPISIADAQIGAVCRCPQRRAVDAHHSGLRWNRYLAHQPLDGRLSLPTIKALFETLGEYEASGDCGWKCPGLPTPASGYSPRSPMSRVLLNSPLYLADTIPTLAVAPLEPGSDRVVRVRRPVLRRQRLELVAAMALWGSCPICTWWRDPCVGPEWRHRVSRASATRGCWVSLGCRHLVSTVPAMPEPAEPLMKALPIQLSRWGHSEF